MRKIDLKLEFGKLTVIAQAEIGITAMQRR